MDKFISNIGIYISHYIMFRIQLQFEYGFIMHYFSPLFNIYRSFFSFSNFFILFIFIIIII